MATVKHLQVAPLEREDLLALVKALRGQHPDLTVEISVIVEPDKEYGSVDFITKHFDLSERTVRGLVKAGRVRHKRPTPANQCRISIHVGDVREWMLSDEYLDDNN